MERRTIAARRGRRLRACQECDLVVKIPVLARGESARCPRCTHLLQHRPAAPLQSEAASCLAALVMFAAALPFSFVSFELQGARQEIVLADSSLAFLSVDYPLLALVVGLAILMLPALYLLAVAYLHVGLLSSRRLPLARPLIRGLRQLEPWMMADVFLVAVLVSMVKIAGQAEVEFGPSFWAFVAFVLLLIRTVAQVNYDALWLRLEGEPQPPVRAQPGRDARAQSLLPCHCCGQLLPWRTLTDGRCPRCDAALPSPDHAPLQATWALLLAAAILYVPANVYPIMITTTLGQTEVSTIIGGVVLLWSKGSWPIALVIFVASIVVPIVKMLVLAWLCLRGARPGPGDPVLRHRLYQFTDFIGRWSMVDVFVVGILVALVQRGTLMAVLPGPAAMAFCAVVILTMLAARAFDPRILWHGKAGAAPGTA